ncbi:enolase C-terminal domain-like protein [Robbsia sp. KACC 23696]|uniref:enolase C-terminal domain-like protein n=1 Tax=Robbsia sp. KACC 23696 TaxID=3149231 RepID=UPI00325BE198
MATPSGGDISSCRERVPITQVRARAFTIPTDCPEADGTFAWSSTTLIAVELTAGSVIGLGYTYTDASSVGLICQTLAPVLAGANVFDIEACWQKLQRHIRNIGREGMCATAISAIDAALWDAKAKLLGLPLGQLLGMVRNDVPIYGSGGFTTYSNRQLQAQLSSWIEKDGCQWVKMKIGTHPEKDVDRVKVARAAIGGTAGLFVDANGAFTVRSALAMAEAFSTYDVSWFEEPVSSDDTLGLSSVRRRAPVGMEIAAGEYGYNTDNFLGLLNAKSVDVLQADASRCGGVTGFLKAAALSDAFHIPFSAHCAPALHRHIAGSIANFRHLEWFHDHVRIETMLFDGAPAASNGVVRLDLSRPGFGIALR